MDNDAARISPHAILQHVGGHILKPHIMKKMIIVAMSLLFAFNCYAQDNEYLLDTDKAGLFTRNMDLENALELAKTRYVVEKSSISLEGDDYDVYNIKLDGQLLLRIEPYCESDCKIWRIWVHSDLYKTDKGIGIGSTIEDIQVHYTVDFLQTEGEGSVFIHLNENDIGFEIDHQALTKEWWQAGAKFEDIPKETKITMIIP